MVSPSKHFNWLFADWLDLLRLHAVLLAIDEALRETAFPDQLIPEGATNPLVLGRLPDAIRKAFEGSKAHVGEILKEQWTAHKTNQKAKAALDGLETAIEASQFQYQGLFTSEMLAAGKVRQWLRYGLWIKRTYEAIKKLNDYADQCRSPAKRIKGTVLGWVGSAPKFTPEQLAQKASTQKNLLDWVRDYSAADESTHIKPWFWCADHATNLGLTDARSHDTDLSTLHIDQSQTVQKLLNPLKEEIRESLCRPTGSRRAFLEDLIRFCGALQSYANYGHATVADIASSRKQLCTFAPQLVEARWTLGSSQVDNIDSLRACESYHVVMQERPSEVVCPPLLADYADSDETTLPQVICKGIIHASPAIKAMLRLKSQLDESPHSCLVAPRLRHVVNWLARRPLRRLWARFLFELDNARNCGHEVPGQATAVEQSLMFEGYWLQKERLRRGDGFPERCLPLHECDGASTNDCTIVSFVEPDGRNLFVGVTVYSEACDPELLIAIEDVDWWMWLIASQRSSISIESALDCINAKEWEPLKRRLAEVSSDPSTLAEGVRHCVLAILRFKRCPVRGLSPHVEADLTNLSRALLRRLRERDPERLGGLDPPRGADGNIDLQRWLIAARYHYGGSAKWRISWQSSELPFGSLIDEALLADDTVLVTLSASRADHRDVRLLELPFVSVWPCRTGLSFFSPDGPLDRFARSIMRRMSEADGTPDMGEALELLRSDLSGPDQRVFHELVHAATSTPPDVDARRWVMTLMSDLRFRFECHPAIEPIDPGKQESGYRIAAVSPTDRVRWVDSEEVPEQGDIEVFYSMDKSASHRTLSRGCPSTESAESIARELEELCLANGLLGHEGLKLAQVIRKYVDAFRTFQQYREPFLQSLIESIRKLLDGFAHAGGLQADEGGVLRSDQQVRRGIYLLGQLAAIFGHSVRPLRWEPRGGALKNEFAEEFPSHHELPIVFHPTISAGDVIVERFEVLGTYATEGRFLQSAGPPPAGFDTLVCLAMDLPDDRPRCHALRQAIRDYPKHVLGDRVRLAIPGLYDTAWNALMECPADRVDLPAWKSAFADFIRDPMELVMFEPTGLGDYPSGWMVGIDGKPPRGRHIARVVRPGVRTSNKSLVWPAIVAME